MSNEKLNIGIMQHARSMPTGIARSLCYGGTISVSGFPNEKNDKTYYVSIFHTAKVIGIGIIPTADVVYTSDGDLANARHKAMTLSSLWNYEIQERIGE